MIKLDLIEFADYSRPNQIVDEIISQNPNIPTPIPIEEIAEAAGICEIQYKPLGALEGALVANKYKSTGVIIVNNKEDLHHRQKYTVGHELGHFMIPSHNHKMGCSIEYMKDNKKVEKIEAQANEFSSKILMPHTIFCKTKYFDTFPSINNIQEQAALFDVSLEACVNRYVSLHHDAVMAIFYKDKKFRYYRKSEYLPFYFSQKHQKGFPAVFGSLSKNVDMSIENKYYEEYVDSSVWFDECSGYILPEEVLEEVYVQTNGYSVTLLKFEGQIEEVEH